MKLFKHQQDALELAIGNNGKAALFHEPGLGKTRTSLETYSHFKALEHDLRLLVVCPLSLISSAWGNDILKFTKFSALPYRQIKRGVLPDIIIINYESLISKRILPEIRNMIARYPFMCVLDESSRLKNNKSMTTKALIGLAPLLRHRLILSGTPMPNSELELWGQVRFVQPEAFDKSFYQFRNKFFHLERMGEQMLTQGKIVTRMMMRQIMMQGWKYTITDFNRKHLMHKIAPFTHWMKKKDALELPEKVDQYREISLSGPEIAAYREMKDYLVTEIGGQMIAAQVALTKMMKLRQVTSGFMYDEGHQARQIGNSKLNELEDVLEELGDQQVLIFAQFHFEIDSIKALIAKKYGADQVATLYAETEDREDSISRFQKNQVKCLIAHPRSAAHGLTFVNCNTIVFFSLDYSYEAHAQARDRIHRIGQVNKCLYIYLVAKGTIDEELLKVLNKKQDLQDIVYAITGNKNKDRSAKHAQEGISLGLGI